MNNEKAGVAASLAAELTGDPAMAARVTEHERATRMVSLLADCRVRKGLTQKAVAERMGVSVSTVSRFEDSRDAEVRMGDLAAYAGAVGVSASLVLEDSGVPAAARIKNCVMRISDDLHMLSRLAAGSNGDASIIDGIHRFRGEVLFNFLLQYERSGGVMPSRIDLAGEDERGGESTQAAGAKGFRTRGAMPAAAPRA